MENRQWIGVGALYLGVCMIGGCWYSLRRSRRWIATSVLTQGTVTAIRYLLIETDENHLIPYPTIRFQSTEGQWIEFEADSGPHRQQYIIGESVSIRYQPNQPDKARINESGSRWVAPIVMGSLGFGALASGIVLTFTTINL